MVFFTVPPFSLRSLSPSALLLLICIIGLLGWAGMTLTRSYPNHQPAPIAQATPTTTPTR